VTKSCRRLVTPLLAAFVFHAPGVALAQQATPLQQLVVHAGDLSLCVETGEIWVADDGAMM
jgi:hypothetical protein